MYRLTSVSDIPKTSLCSFGTDAWVIIALKYQVTCLFSNRKSEGDLRRPKWLFKGIHIAPNTLQSHGKQYITESQPITDQKKGSFSRHANDDLKNNWFYKQNNSSALASRFLVHISLTSTTQIQCTAWNSLIRLWRTWILNDEFSFSESGYNPY